MPKLGLKPLEECEDPMLAKTMRAARMPAPIEKIERTERLLTVLNRDKLGDNLAKRIVTLACGHMEVTRNEKKCACTTCHAMILNGEDYEGFRNG